MAVLLAHSASHFYPHPSEKTITQPFCQPFARWKRFNYSYLINTGASSSSHQESEPNLNTRKGQQDSSRKEKTLYDHFRTQKAPHCGWHTLPERRFLRFAFFFLSKCCLPACLRTIFPLPVTENLFADACHFPNPEVTDHQAHSDRHFGRHEACGDRNWLIFSISRFVLLTDSVISKTTSGPTGEQAWQWICTKWVRRRMFGWIQENPLLSEKQKVQSVPSFLSKRKHLKQEIHKSGNNKQQPTLWVFSL